MLRFSTLGSGSDGNAFVLSSGDEAIIIDLGFSRKELKKRLSQLGIAPERLIGALLTHDHCDHSCGCRVFCDELNLPLYTTCGTANFLRRRNKLPAKVMEFESGEAFTIGGFEIKSFPVPHDAEEPVGFTICADGLKIGIATDLGYVTSPVRYNLRDCDLLVLESNYDPEMLRNSDRDLRLKRRIAGRLGHLNNEGAAKVLEELLTSRTKSLLLAHMSRECNAPELIRECCAAKLCELGFNDLHFDILRQEIPSGTIEVDENGNPIAAPDNGAFL